MEKKDIFILGVIILGLGLFLFGGNKANAPVNTVTNFEECIAGGNPVMESYPRQCTDKEGNSFTEEVFETFTNIEGLVNYSVDVPLGWFSHKNGSTVIFTQDPDLEIPANTELYAIGDNFYITVSNITDIEGITTYEDWLDINGMTTKSEMFVESHPVDIGGYEMLRVVTEGAGVSGNVLSYVYFVDNQRVVTLSQFPYESESNISKVFESVVKTFRVPERQQNGESVACEESQRGVDACIEIYQPVCATVNIQCITTPCDPIEETFSNSCFACQNPLVSYYSEGECVNQ